MPSRDANNSTWYVLRYATDFAPRQPGPADPVPPQLVPDSPPTLFYDDTRHVLELLPARPPHEVPPPAGLAVDVDGDVYLVDPETGRLRVRRCDGSQTPLPGDPCSLRAPAGMALDRRGLLYVADPAAGRVVVLLPEDGSVYARLEADLREPVDVAVSPAGRVYVTDRAAGRVAVFTARFTPAGHFTPRDPDGLPAAPRPIAVMIDADGTVLVADANHPRLLRFAAGGEPLGDVELATLARPLAGDPVSLDEPWKAYGDTAPRFVAGACSPGGCAEAVPDEGGARLASVHRDLRLLALHLSHTFQPRGVFLSAALDGKSPGVTWHKIGVGADLPPGARLTIETATAETREALASPADWAAPGLGGQAIAFTPGLPDQLIQSPPGRYLRLRVTLESDGQTTPGVRWVKVVYPRVSYLDSLPRVYRRDPDSALFLEHYLSLFERVFTGVEDRYEAFSRQLNPDAAPLDVINWLGLLIDLSFDPSWPLRRRRALVGEAMGLYRRRGTPGGIERYVEIYTGMKPVIQEAFLNRPGRPALLGSGNSFLGAGLALSALPSATGTSSAAAAARPAGPGDLTPEQALYRQYAHQFTVVVFPADACQAEALLPVIDRIVQVNKPAHTAHTVRAVYPDARVDAQSTVGVDYVVGGATAAGTQLGGCPAPGHPSAGAGVLGIDTVLGNRRLQYLRPVDQVL